MAANEARRLDLKDLDAVLAQAKAEGWTELALLGGFLAKEQVTGLVRAGWPGGRVFILREPLREVPATLSGLDSLTALDLSDNRIDEVGAAEISRLDSLTRLALDGNLIGDAGAVEIARLAGLTSLNLGSNEIGVAGATALAQLTGLTDLDLANNQTGDAGAAALTRLTRLTSLNLAGNQVGDAGATALAQLTGLTALYIENNWIGDMGAAALAQLTDLTDLDLANNQIGDAGATALARLTGLTWLALGHNQIGEEGARAILDAWADPATAERRRVLDLGGNGGLRGLLPAEVLEQIDAQVIIAAWRQRKAEEALLEPLPPVDAVGEPARSGLQVGLSGDGRLTFADQPITEGARNDAIGQELHGEVVEALDRLIAAAGQSNVVAEWREVAEAAKERLGAGPRAVRVSAILRIARLRSLREADERRRLAPDPLVEPAEAGVAAALRDAVEAANLYVETDPYLAEQQRRLADPEAGLTLTTEEAAAAEAAMAALDIAEPALLAELRLGRETAEAGGRAGERALAWLRGSWRNTVREVVRRVLAWVWEQAKAGAGEVAMQARIGAAITVGEAAAMLAAAGHHAKNATAATARAGAAGLRIAGRAFATGAGLTGGSIAMVAFAAFLESQFALLARLGWSADFNAILARLIGL